MKYYISAMAALLLLSNAAVAGDYSEGSSSTFMHGTNSGSSASYGYVVKKAKRYQVETNALAIENAGPPTRAEREQRRLEEKNEGSLN